MKILVVNAGSSSLKCSLFSSDRQKDLQATWSEQIDWPASDKDSSRQSDQDRSTRQTHENTRGMAARSLLSRLWTGADGPVRDPSEIDVVGHRIVHGGGKYFSPTLISEQVMQDLHEYITLAPTHEPVNIEGVEIARDSFKGATQVAVFDTAYHHSMPEPAIVYAGPYEWYRDRGLRRFGFHGISHEFCVGRAAELLNVDRATLRIITCHLGSGASLAATRDNVCQMTTMGFTPLEGLVMSTRCGSIDPGLILHLLKQGDYSVEQLSEVLNKQSGLKGLSGTSGDMRAIESELSAGNERARLAFNVYIRALTAQISSLVPCLGGLDILVFAGGVGENSSRVRESACAQLTFLGVDIDTGANRNCKPDTDISSKGASVKTLVIHTREDLSIARACAKFAEHSMA